MNTDNACYSGAQSNFCPRTIDDVLPSVVALLPPGPAYDGAGLPGTVQNMFWRSFSSLLGYTYDRLCAYVDEFFCATVKESFDQWALEYDLNSDCDPYGGSLCLKVAATSVTTCEGFVEFAAQLGVVMTCVPVDDDAIAGCATAGCTTLGPTPVFAGRGQPLGYGPLGACDFGEVVHHPDPARWENGNTAGSLCKVPGSNLGYGPDEHEGCCPLAGYYDFEPSTVSQQTDFCARIEDVIRFECPREDLPYNPAPRTAPSITGAFDSTGNYSEWGSAFLWEVEVDIAASDAARWLIGVNTEQDDNDSTAGFAEAGCVAVCTTPSAPPIIICFLERMKPAHTQLIVKVKQ